MMSKQSGFSLLEILIALLIFSVIGLATQGLVSSAIKYQESVVTRTEQLEDIAEIALRMRADFLQIINRPVELYDTTQQASFVGTSSSVIFTKSGWDNPLQVKRSNYQRVTYISSATGLKRQHSQWLDIADEADIASREFKNITKVSFQYLNSQMIWMTSWSSASQGSLPRAIKVSFSTQGFRGVERTFEVPSFEYNATEEEAP